MGLLKYILKYFKKNRRIFLIIICANFLTFTLSLLLPCLNGYFFDTLIYHPTRKKIIEFGIFIVILGFISTLLTYFFNIYKSKVQSKLNFYMFNDIILHVQRADYAVSGKYNPTYLHQRLTTDVGKLWGFFFDHFINSVFHVFTILIVAAAIGKMSVPLFLLTMIVVPIYIIGYYVLKKPLYEKGIQLKDVKSRFYKSMNEQFEFIKTIKLWGSYKANEKKRKTKFESYLKGFMDYTKVFHLYNSLESSISISFKVTALMIGGLEIMNGNLTVGRFTIIASYFGMLIQSIKFFFSFGQGYLDAKNSYDRIKELLNLEQEASGIVCPNDIINRLCVRQLSFSYGEKEVFDNFQWVFYPGLNLVLGVNGKGKTTLIYIICGLYHGREEESIYFNEDEILKLDLEYLRKHKISIYLQSQRGMDETVSQMLQEYMDTESCDIEKVIRRKGLESLYLTEKFHISEYMDRNLKELSGGEAQLLYLLPVLTKEADILILDEPTSDLDTETKDKAVEILRSMKKRIVIIITHEEYLYRGESNINILKL